MTALTLLTACLLGTALAAPGPSAIEGACLSLTRGDAGLARSCVQHAGFFETSIATVNACRDFHENVEFRLRCLKSGADADAVRLCSTTGWSLDGIFTCFRSYPTKELLRACRRLGPSEAVQIRCLRTGRDHAQVDGCADTFSLEEERFACLRLNPRQAETRRCAGETDRLACLEEAAVARGESAATERRPAGKKATRLSAGKN